MIEQVFGQRPPKPSRKVIRVCEHCGKTFSKYPSELRKAARFCSWECFLATVKGKEGGYVQIRSQSTHGLLIKAQLETLNAQGFRCVPIGLPGFPRPDIIAFKEGKIYAYEVERNSPNKKKYNGISSFDEIVWVRENA